MASRDPKDLTPDLQAKWAKFEAAMIALGYEPILTCTNRSNEEQASLYAIGRTVNIGHRVITDKKPGQSRHNSLPAQAFDIAILIHGKLIWDAGSEPWKRARDIGAQVGLQNLHPFESCHFQEPDKLPAI